MATPRTPLSPAGVHPLGAHWRHPGRPRPQPTAPRDPTAASGPPPATPRARARDPAPSPARARPSGPRPPHLAGPLHGVGESVLADPRASPAGRLGGTPGRPPARAAAAGAAAAPVPRARRARRRASPGAPGSPGSPAAASGRRRPGRGSSRAVVRHGAAGPGLARRLKLRRRRRRRRLNAGTRPRSTRPRSTLGTQRLGRRRGGRGTPPPAAGVTDGSSRPMGGGRRSWDTNRGLWRRAANRSAARGSGREVPRDRQVSEAVGCGLPVLGGQIEATREGRRPNEAGVPELRDDFRTGLTTPESQVDRKEGPGERPL